MREIATVRLSKGLAASDVANWLGLTTNQYLTKERGAGAFRDYEMLIASQKLDVSITDLFFSK